MSFRRNYLHIIHLANAECTRDKLAFLFCLSMCPFKLYLCVQYLLNNIKEYKYPPKQYINSFSCNLPSVPAKYNTKAIFSTTKQSGEKEKIKIFVFFLKERRNIILNQERLSLPLNKDRRTFVLSFGRTLTKCRGTLKGPSKTNRRQTFCL